MTSFQINLIRKQVPSPGARRRLFLVMLAYLSVSGLFLVWVSYHATRDLLKARRMRLRTDAMQAQFREEHPGHTDVVLYGRNVEKQTEAFGKKIALIDGICQQRTDLGRIILALSAPLPSDVDLSALELKRKKQTLEFDLDFPVSTTGQAIDASRLIAAWNENPTITSQLSKITSVRSEKKTVDGRLMEKWHFTCFLLAKGGV